MPVELNELCRPASFNESRIEAMKYEAKLDQYLSTLGKLRRPSFLADRSLGIDRLLLLPNEVLVSFQYKVEHAAERTGNFFIETEQELVQDCDKAVTKVWPGWYKTILAQMMLSYVPGKDVIHCCNVARLKSLSSLLFSRYPSKRCRLGSKEAYSSTHTLFGVGLIVPIQDLQELGVITRIIKGESAHELVHGHD